MVLTMSINYRGLTIPCIPLGREITSDNLFDPNEQVIFDFYEANADRYCRAVDIGANIGVHSILMARQGWEVRAYEPDPAHFNALSRNIILHGAPVNAWRAAVSDHDGLVSFVLVLDNLTGNHILGAKDSYGPTDMITVQTVCCIPLFDWADFVKMDCEGYEAHIILALPARIWDSTDVMLEVGSSPNATAIYTHLRGVVPMWAQKIGWKRVVEFRDMPTNHREGSLFIGKQPPFRDTEER